MKDMGDSLRMAFTSDGVGVVIIFGIVRELESEEYEHFNFLLILLTQWNKDC